MNVAATELSVVVWAKPVSFPQSPLSARGRYGDAPQYPPPTPANQGYQARLRGGYGAAWAGRLGDHRRATGLASDAGGTSKAVKAPEGHIRADIHVHGNAHKATVRTRGAIEASLTRWPKMHHDYA